MRYLRIAVAIATVLSLAASWTAHAQEKLGTLRVHVFPGAYTSMSLHVAQEKGFFAKNGLDVELVPAQSSSAAIAAMLGGSIDVVESGADLVLSSIEKGIPLKYLMANEAKNYVTFIGSKEFVEGVKGKSYPEIFRELKGKRFGVNAIGATLHLAAVMMLKEAGLSEGDVQFVATGTASNTLAAWQAGTVDVQLTFPPVPQLLGKLGLAESLLVLADDGPDILKFRNLYSGWVTTDGNISGKKKEIDAYISAMKEAIDWMKSPDNRQELVSLAEKHTPISMLPEGNEQVLRDVVDQYDRFWGYEISSGTIDLWNEYAARNGLISAPVQFDRVVYEGAPKCTDPCQ